MIEIRRAKDSDFDGIWQIFHQVIGRGDTFAASPETTEEQARSIWMSEGVITYVALLGIEIVGAYLLRPNQPGLGSHVANAAYMVSPIHTRKGIGRMMCEHSLEEARKTGFLAMQFNKVVSTNQAAIELYKKIGFAIVGTVPKAFQHRALGLVDVFIMHRFL
jgi:L-amino acid N-acyltransferase YncA